MAVLLNSARSWYSPARAALLLFGCWCIPVPATAACQAPPYFQVLNTVGPEGAGSIHVWVPPERFTVERITCLAQALSSKQPTWRNVAVLIFTSEEAAENF